MRRLDHRPRARCRREWRAPRRRRHTGRHRQTQKPDGELLTRGIEKSRQNQRHCRTTLETSQTKRHFSIRQRHHAPRRAPSQPQEPLARHPARSVRRDFRAIGLGKIHPRLRHPFCRRPAPLPRFDLGLRAAIRRTTRTPGDRSTSRPATDGRDRTTRLTRRRQIDGRNGHRALELHPTALLKARHDPLPGLPGAGRKTIGCRHRECDPSRIEKRRCLPARAADPQQKRLSHGNRRMGAETGIY